jgi:hypothetical protein
MTGGEKVVVTGADREAVTMLISSSAWQRRRVLAGEHDSHVYVQAFARHRQSALSDAVEIVREARRSIDSLLAEHGNLAWTTSQAEGPGAAQAKATLARLTDFLALNGGR